VFPLLKNNENPDLVVHACDYSKSAIEVVKVGPLMSLHCRRGEKGNGERRTKFSNEELILVLVYCISFRPSLALVAPPPSVSLQTSPPRHDATDRARLTVT
jgi:hypothetical protein